jgi:hypothetical protein
VFQFILDRLPELSHLGPPDPDEVADRLLQLHETVVRLRDACWPVWFTVGGIGFRAPDNCDNMDEVRRRLADLDVSETFEAACSPTRDDLLRADAQYKDLRWYDGVVQFLRSPGYHPRLEFRRRPHAVRDMLARKQAIEQRYPWGALHSVEERLKAIVQALALDWLRGSREPETWSPSPLWDAPDESDRQALDEPAPTPGGG